MQHQDGRGGTIVVDDDSLTFGLQQDFVAGGATACQGRWDPIANVAHTSLASSGDWVSLMEGTSLAVARFGPDGQPRWQQSFAPEGASATRGWSVQQTSDGYVILGEQVATAGSGDVLLVKLGLTGELLWQRTYDGLTTTTMSGSGDQLAQHDDGFSVLVRRLDGQISVLRVDRNGEPVSITPLWNAFYSPVIASARDGGTLVGGLVGSRTVMLARVAPTGR